MTEDERNAEFKKVLPSVVDGHTRPTDPIPTDMPYSDEIPQLISNDPASYKVFNVLFTQVMSNFREILSKFAQYSFVDHIHDDRYYLESEVDAKLSNKVDTSALATVAVSGSYNDLLDKPTQYLTIDDITKNVVINAIGYTPPTSDTTYSAGIGIDITDDTISANGTLTTDKITFANGTEIWVE